jgi:hypothetical protein
MEPFVGVTMRVAISALAYAARNGPAQPSRTDRP